MMKKYLCVNCLFTVIICLYACSEMVKPEDGLPDYISFNQLAEGYGVENAVEDDCVVFVDFKLISGEDIWKTFMTKAGKKQSCCVRIVNYDSIDGYFCLSDLLYEGTSFHVDTSEGISREYSYLNHYEIDIKESDSSDSVMDLYILVDKEDATYDEIQKSRASSYPDGGIDSYTVYLNEYHP